MKKLSLSAIALATVLAAISTTAFADADEREASLKAAKATPLAPEEKIARVIEVLDKQMNAPAEKRISAALLDNAQCMAVIPDLEQAGLGIGIKHGTGIVTCRHEADGTWGVPAFVRLSGASVGLQLGVQKMDVVMLSMTDNGLNQLLNGKPIVSGDAGVAIGPVGRNAEVALDVLLQTPLLSYTRSEGFYAGASMGGSVFTTAKKVNKEIYGEYDNARSLLLEYKAVPAMVKPLLDTLDTYAPSDTK